MGLTAVFVAKGQFIAKEVAVGDLLVEQGTSPTLTEAAPMIERKVVAVAAVEFVVTEETTAQEGAALLPQVAVLAHQHAAASGDITRGDSGILIGGDVPVERQADIRAVPIRGAQGGWQQATLAPLQREVEIGAVEEGHTHK